MKKLLIVPFLLLLVASTATAAEFVAPSGKDGNVTISQSETRRNLYVAGGNVTVNANISGDLYAAGGMVSVTGNVEQDLNVAGGNLNLNGSVGGDLRVAGGNIIINSPVSGDLLAGGGNISISERTTIGGDLTAGGGMVSLDGPVSGNAKIGGGNVFINSTIRGTVEVQADERLTFGPKSVVTGKIVYKGPVEAEVQAGAQISVIEYTKLGTNRNQFAAFLTIAYLVKLIAVFLAAWLIMYLWPRRTHAHSETVRKQFLKSLGIGLLLLIVTPILAVLLFITGIGMVIGLVLLAVFLMSLLMAGILLSVFTGVQLMTWFKKREVAANWQTLILGLVAITILCWIPFVGWIVVFVLFLASLGGLVIRLYDQTKSEKHDQVV